MELTQGSVARRLIRFSLPIIITNIFGQLYSLIDSVVVAQFAGEQSLSVLSVVNGCMTIGYCLVQGAAGACHIVLAKHFGAQQFDEVRDSARTMRLVMGLFSLITALAYIALADVIFRIMNVPADMVSECRAALTFYALTMPVMGVNMVNTAIMNGSGDSRTPMLFGTSAQVLNLILDYLAVAIWGMGGSGAAAASLFSIVAETVCMFFRSNREIRKYVRGRVVYRKKYAVLMAKIGLPSIAQRSVFALGVMALQTLVNGYGTDGINSFTVGNTISNFLLVPVLACCTGYETFAAQNLGAGEYGRVREGWRILQRAGIVLNLLLTGAAILFANAFIGLYLPDRSSPAFELARGYFLLLVPTYFLQFWKSSFEAVFKSRLKVTAVAVSSSVSLVVRTAYGYIFAPAFGINALGWATTVGCLAALAYCIIYFKCKVKSVDAA